MKSIGAYIKENRKAAGLTQEVFAVRAGLGLRFVRDLEQGSLRRVLFAGTGALMSPLTTLQGESIPGIAHAVLLERTDL